MWTRSVAAALGGVLGAGGVSSAQPGGGPLPANVRVEAVRGETVDRLREVTGELRAVRLARVASEEAGLVVELTAEAGDRVEEGQVIARLRDELKRFELERREAEERSAAAQVVEREAQVEKAERDLKRLSDLQRQQGASETEVDDARTRVKEAEARLAQARADALSALAESRTARQRLSDMQIRAPFAGSVVAKAAEVGAWVREGDTVVELVQFDTVDAYIDVPERFVRTLTPGKTGVEVRLPALGLSRVEKVDTIVASGDRLARTFPVRVRMANADGVLRPGMSVVALVPTGEPMEAMTISKDAVLRSDAGPFVYFDAGGVAAIAPVETVFASGERYVIRSPVLKPGMTVIVEGNERVFPGQPLNILKASPGGAQGAPREGAAGAD
ncbi:MAG TPA: hypothetical protein DEB06_03115, partial [Phycisphaerales bacterium]|nr:hypothetical protein [Phycisphaerales bacterium]